MMNYFIYAGKSSREYGIYISGEQTFSAPERDIKKIEILHVIFLESVVYYIVNAEKRKSNIHMKRRSRSLSWFLRARIQNPPF